MRAYALVCGGGTAGHVRPALAIAEALVARGHAREDIHYVGSERGIEGRLVPPSGFSLTLLPGRGFQRRLALANVGAVVGLVRALVRAVLLVRRTRPAVVVAVGGYASVPCAMAALLWRIPIVVAEQNAVPGAANRLLARFARAAATSFPGTPLPRASVTGNPVRSDIGEIDRDTARAKFGIGEGRLVLLVFGGSLGSLRINRAVLDALHRWRERDDLALRHAVGERDWAEISASAPSLPPGGIQYLPVPYEDDMPTALAAADLAVTRAGSSTIFELASAHLPAVLVPSPNVTGDHQTANAHQLAASGAAVVVSDTELDGARIVAEVDALLADPGRLRAMSAAAGAFARPRAADDIAALADRHARG